MQAYVDEIRRPRGQTVLKEKTTSGARQHIRQTGPFGPRFFRRPCLHACRGSRRLPCCTTVARRQASTGSSLVEPRELPTLGIVTSLAAYWYFHIPNFILAALMYTMLGRALLGLMVDADSPNYIWRFFCSVTDPVVAVIRSSPQGSPRRWSGGCSVSSGCSDSRHVSLHVAGAQSRPPSSREQRHEPQLLFYRHRLFRHDQRHL